MSDRIQDLVNRRREENASDTFARATSVMAGSSGILALDDDSHVVELLGTTGLMFINDRTGDTNG
jgi:hypothetical protein